MPSFRLGSPEPQRVWRPSMKSVGVVEGGTGGVRRICEGSEMFGVGEGETGLTGKGCPFYLLWESGDLRIEREETTFYCCT